MYQAGVPLRHMRICEPFGPEQQTRIMALYAVIKRSLGSYAAPVKQGKKWQHTPDMTIISMGIGKSSSQNVTGKNMHYCCSIACQEKTAEHYRNATRHLFALVSKKGIEVPQTQQGDIGTKDIPSWRRISKVLLNNDYSCQEHYHLVPTKAKRAGCNNG